jgi:tetratricopeptide (TPR) repeat protein
MDEQHALIPRSGAFHTLGRMQSASTWLSVTFCLAITLWLSTGGQALAGGSSDNSALAGLETRLFFTTYSKEDLPARLARLEKRIFGDELSGSTDERLQRLLQSQNAPLNPYGTPQEPAQPPARQEEQAPVTYAAPPVAAASRPQQQPAKSEPEEQDCAIDRARVAVQAAKEEEITQLLSEGVELWRNRRAEEATQRFEQVVRLDPNNSQAHFSLGIIEESQGNYVEALASYKKACQTNPKNKDYRDALAAAEKKASTKEVSIEKRSEISKLAESATAAFRRGEYLSALDLYKTLDQKAPHQALVKYNIGSIYLVMKQPEKALEYYKEAHKLNPGEPRYAQAFEQLQTAVHTDESARQQEYSQFKQQSRFNVVKPTSAPLSESAMASFGILGKGHGDGVMVTTVGMASKALHAGLQQGDIIKAVDGTVVTSTRELNDALSRKAPGQPVMLVVQRAKTIAQVSL